MATGSLTEAQRNKVAKILKQTPESILTQVTYMADLFTSAVQTDVEAEITRWEAGASTKFVRVHPRERNRGVEINPGDEKQDIKDNLALLLNREDWASSGSGSGGTASEFTFARA